MPVKIKWICDNEQALISLYRSEEEIQIEQLPEPILENSLEKEYIDPEEGLYFYMLKSIYNNEIFFSKQILSKIDVVGEFIFNLNEVYSPPLGNNIIFRGIV